MIRGPSIPALRGAPWLRRLLLASLAIVWIVVGAPHLAAQATRTQTVGVFSRFEDRVTKIQVVESGSAARASIGSGFFVSADGHVVTNYHVISQAVHDPQRYRAELVDSAGETHPLAILALDVVNDLAVVHAALAPAGHFTLAPASVEQGERLYALGHPNDLGLSIIEGTYNGLLRHTLYPRIHFTGSLNPGMSGGPTIAEDGRVLGVNVATSGNQVSFLVPADRAAELVATALAPGYAPPEDLLAVVGRQIHEYQDVYLDGMFDGSAKTVELGRYRVPTEPAPFFRCWGDAWRAGERPYEQVYHSCSTNDYLYIAGGQRAGVVELSHELLTTTALNRFQFAALYTNRFAADNTPSGVEEHVTSWRCSTGNVRNGATPVRATLCLRRYRKLDALYDAVLKVAVLGHADSGLVSTLTLSGVSYENVDRLSRRYLEQITWR